MSVHKNIPPNRSSRLVGYINMYIYTNVFYYIDKEACKGTFVNRVLSCVH